MLVDAAKLLLPAGEMVGMRGLGALAYCPPSNPLTLLSPPGEEGK